MNINALAQVLYEDRNFPAKWENANQWMRTCWEEAARATVRKVEQLEREEQLATLTPEYQLGAIEKRFRRIEEHLGMR